MAISTKLAMVISMGFIASMSWLLHEVGQPQAAVESGATLLAGSAVQPLTDFLRRAATPPVDEVFVHASAVAPVELAGIPAPVDEAPMLLSAGGREPALPPLHTVADYVEEYPRLASVPADDVTNNQVWARNDERSQRVEAQRPPAPSLQDAGAAAGGAPGDVYVVQKGDSLIKIARLVYGSGERAHVERLLAANAQLRGRPELIRIGEELQIPPADWRAPTAADVLAAARHAGETAGSAERGPALVYVVQPNDSLSRIAQQQLKSTARWHEIAEMNGLAESDRLLPGMQLKLPALELAASGM